MEDTNVTKSELALSPATGRAFNLPGGHLSSSKSSDSQAGISPTSRALFPMLGEKTLYGLAGEFVKNILPHTEADCPALLVQMLVGFGNLVGRSAYHLADGARHHLNLYAVLVGKTSAAKGSALAHVQNQLRRIDEEWASIHVKVGLSSGEGLIKAVDDASGVSDKRLLVTESEFASILHMHSREGNILSSVMRNLWDNGRAATMTKNNPVSTTDAHVSVIGHITPEELARYLGKTEIYNGYANRFLFACVRRSKDLPDGGSLSEADAARLTERFQQAVSFAKGVGEMKRDEEAADLWRGVYPKLVVDKPGTFGKVIARRRAQVLRLSCLYALLNCSATVRRVHLEAALALWQFCEDSAYYTFGADALSPNARKLLGWLREADGAGLNKTDIYRKFGRRIKAPDLDAALEELTDANTACREEIPTAGRTEERWYAVAEDSRTYELDEGSQAEDSDSSDSSF